MRWSPTLSSAGNLPSSLTAIDVNNDTLTDLVLTNTSSNNLVIFLGISNGTFRIPGQVYDTNDGPSSITHGDVKNDMSMDLAVVNRQSNPL